MAVLWGIPYLLIRVAVRELDPGAVVLFRTAPAALLLMPVVIRRRAFPALRKNLGWITVFGIVEFGIPWYLMSTSERHINSSLTSLIICAVPLFSVVASRFTRSHEPISARRLVGLHRRRRRCRAPRRTRPHGRITHLDWHDAAGLRGVRHWPHHPGDEIRNRCPVPPSYAAPTSVVALGWIPYDVFHWPSRVSAETWMSVGVLSVFCTAGAFLVFFELIKEAGSSRSVVVVYSNTAIAVLLGVVGLHEPFTIGIALGFPLIVLGSYLATSVTHGVSHDADRDTNLPIYE